MVWKVNHQWSRRGGHAGQKKRGNGVSFSKPRTPLYHRIHKFKSSNVKSIVDLGVNSRFIHSDPDLIRTHFMASTTPPQIAVAVVRHLSSSNLALLWICSVIDKGNSLRKFCRKETVCQLNWILQSKKNGRYIWCKRSPLTLPIKRIRRKFGARWRPQRSFPSQNPVQTGTGWLENRTKVRVSAGEKNLAWCCKYFCARDFN